MPNPCHPIIKILRRLTRPIRRHWVKHKILHAVAAVGVGCVGVPVALLYWLPPTVAATPEVVRVPEPSALGIFVLGVIVLGLMKRRRAESV